MDGCKHHRFHWSALFRKLLAAAETDGKKLLDSVFELGFKESEVQRAAWKRTWKDAHLKSLTAGRQRCCTKTNRDDHYPGRWSTGHQKRVLEWRAASSFVQADVPVQGQDMSNVQFWWSLLNQTYFPSPKTNAVECYHSWTSKKA